MSELAKSELDVHPDSNSSSKDSRTFSHITINSQPLSPSLHNLSSSNQSGHRSPSGHGTTTFSHPIRIPGTGMMPVEATIESGPGPTRHPKPLTPAELFAQLEKEQEAVVNRLTRELSILRAAHNSSVVSNSSSTSASILPESMDYNPNHLISGSSYPSPSFPRRHRSSSAASNFSNAAGIAASMVPHVAGDRARGIGPTKHEGGLGTSLPGSGTTGRSRHDSVGRVSIQGQHHGIVTSPSLIQKHPGNLYSTHSVDALPSCNRPHSSTQRYFSGSKIATALNTGVEKETQFSPNFQEMAPNCEELEILKKENEFLKQRVKDLEDLLNKRKKENPAADTEPDEVSSTAT